MANNAQQVFGYVTLWLKGNLAAMVDEFDPENRDGIAASGNISIKKENIPQLVEYLNNQEDRNGYVSLDMGIFFADADKVGDLRGTVKELYVKDGSKSNGKSSEVKAKRSL